MKGNNEIILNTATMIEAMQLWVDANFKDPPRVTGIDRADNGHCATFKVKLEEPKGNPIP
jgi:hypothetical protein